MYGLPDYDFQFFLKIAEFICKTCGYSFLMLSDNANFNLYLNNGFTRCFNGINRRSGNHIEGFWKELK